MKPLANQLGIVLKEKQAEVIISFISGNDMFISLPTGYGKSIIFAVSGKASVLAQQWRWCIIY